MTTQEREAVSALLKIAEETIEHFGFFNDRERRRQEIGKIKAVFALQELVDGAQELGIYDK